jgi:lipopolysaccharide export system permease protein
MFKHPFSIIDRYVSKELLLTWLAVTLVLILILLSSALARLLGDAAAGTIPSDAVWPLLMFTGAQYFILLVPLSLYLGVLLNFSRMYKDNEMAAMGACGISLMRLYRPLLMVVIPATLVLFYLTLYVMPWISQQAELLKIDMENRSQLTGLTAGRFNDFDKGNATIFLQRQSEDGEYMHDVFVHKKSAKAGNQQFENIESADVARRYKDEKGRHFILFEQGKLYEGEPGRSDFRITRYEKKGIYMPETKSTGQISRRQSLETSELWGSDRVNYRAELHWRISLPIAAFLLAVLALPLSYTTPRKGRYSKLALAILIYLFYSNLLGVGETWIEKQEVAAWVGLWWVHGLMAILIAYWWSIRAGGIKQLMLQKKATRQM